MGRSPVTQEAQMSDPVTAVSIAAAIVVGAAGLAGALVAIWRLVGSWRSRRDAAACAVLPFSSSRWLGLWAKRFG
jgi:multisubunit Na+/H+ antiporter MnhC subunit